MWKWRCTHQEPNYQVSNHQIQIINYEITKIQIIMYQITKIQIIKFQSHQNSNDQVYHQN